MSLRELNESFSAMLEKQVQGKAIPKSVDEISREVATTYVGGFPVVYNGARQRQISDHIERMKKYALVRAQLISDIEHYGIKVLATLPQSYWGRLCTESGLVDFRTNDDGKICFNATGAVRVYNTSLRMMAVAMAMTIAAAIITAGYFIGQWNPPTGILLSIIGLAFTACSVTELQSLAAYLKGNRLAKKASFLTRFIIDDGVDFNTKVNLPTPPADVQEVLRKLSKATTFKNYIRTAAVPQALAFSPSIGSLMASGVRAELEEARQRLMDADPIVYIVRGGVVAIVAQFGDFPIEQKLVDKLTKEEVVELPY